MKSSPTKIIYYLGLFLVITGISYFAFSRFARSSGNNPTQTVNTPTSAPIKAGILTFSGPKTEVCPLNGQLFTKDEKNLWSTKRPLVVMIENHADSRPQSGLNNADIVYEAVAEGGITRFEAVFYCNVVKGAPNKYDVGPVRSARTYFLDIASEYADYPLYAHVGGANCSGSDSAVKTTNCSTDVRAQALEQISKYSWTSKGTWGDLNQFSLSYKACRREPDRTGTEKATEHTMYCSTSELWNVAAARGLTNMTLVNNTSWDKNFRSWLFKAPDLPASTATAINIAFDFWSGYKDYSVAWKYSVATKEYIRTNAGQPTTDFNDNEPLTAKDVIIQFAKESRSIDEHLHNLYGVIGTGTGVLLQNGTKTDITWSKANRTSRTIFKDTTGKEVNLVPGRIWVEILPIGASVSYEG
ncbi:MAG: DUF3048 domain-containing protein [Candidatus Shapirobacteria bacterium]|nr:DUF3048 domain-containing protein [Candidatus Shapirobacteria bacterium]